MFRSVSPQDLQNLLQSGSGMPGRIILSHFEQEKSLDESCRDDLADIILNEFLKDDYNRK